MPTNKNAQLRYQILDRCFSDKHHLYNIEDLLKKVNDSLYDLTGYEVSLRQIRDDIKYMRDRLTFNAPIEAIPYNGKKCYYRYSDLNFSIFKNELSIKDVEKLHSTLNMLSSYRGIPGNVWLEEVISNLEYRLGVKSDPQNLIFFEQNDRLQGLKYLSDLIDKTIGHVTIDVFYCTYTGSEHLMTIHPYFLKEYNGRWFLFGLNEKYNNISNLALDRIIRYRRSDIPFKKNDVIDVNSYFNDIVGVTIPKQDKEIESIRIRFSERRFPYVVSKPIHHSQIVVDSNTVEIKVKQTKELDQQIFSYIPDAVVLSPEWYRNYIREKIEDSLKKYLSVQNDCTDGCELCQ